MRYSRQDCTVSVRNNSGGSPPTDTKRVETDTRLLCSVRSREGRRNRNPPPRVRFNKDGKKINPQQAVAGKAIQA